MTKQIAFGFIFMTTLNVNALANGDANITLELSVTESGFEPKSVDTKPGSDVILKVTRKTDKTCAKEIHLPSKKIKAELPLNKQVTVALGKLEKGEIRFACGMDMISGKILVQ